MPLDFVICSLVFVAVNKGALINTSYIILDVHGHRYSGVFSFSFFCFLLISLVYLFQVCGYRVKLHFDGYSDCYDFWVNADALDIHPVGWCEKTGHKLHPPKGIVTFLVSYFKLKNLFSYMLIWNF